MYIHWNVHELLDNTILLVFKLMHRNRMVQPTDLIIHALVQIGYTRETSAWKLHITLATVILVEPNENPFNIYRICLKY